MMKQRQKNKLYDISYRRLDKEKESGSESGEETELFSRSKPQRKEIPTIEKVIEDEDSLQSLAIKYHCTIAELKRLNNIHKENEIFARRTVKVPDRPFTMALAGVHVSGKSSPNGSSQPSTSRLIDIDFLNTKLSDGHIGLQNGMKEKVNDIIFNSNIVQKPSDRLNEESCIEEYCEEVNLLPNRQMTSSETVTVVSNLNCSGADGDISWIALIVCIVIVIFAIPIIYVVYIAEHKDQYLQHIS